MIKQKVSDFLNTLYDIILYPTDMNLVNMILNLDHNDSNNYKKVLDVYAHYIDFKEIPFSQDFRKSLQSSKNAIFRLEAIQKEIECLKKNDSNSFLVLPLLGYGHLWSTVIRNTNEGISATVINKGLRYLHDPVEEFVFKHENLGKLIHTLDFASGMEDVNLVYKTFLNNSDASYNLKINAGPQKVGNCFTKNIQAGIKFAAATRNMSPNKINSFRYKGYTSLGTKRKRSTTFKWENIPTMKAQKLFVEDVIQKNPRIREEAKSSLDIYMGNKLLREKLKKGMNPNKSIIASFQKDPSADPQHEHDLIKSHLKKITSYTFDKFSHQLAPIIKKLGDSKMTEAYEKLKFYKHLGKTFSKNSAFSFYVSAGFDPFKSLERIFDPNNQLRNDSPTQKIKKLVKNLTLYNLIRHQTPIRELLTQAYGKEQARNEYVACLKNEMVNSGKYIKDTPFMIYDLEKISKTFPLVTKDLKSQVSVFLSKETPKNIFTVPRAKKRRLELGL
jgi:hypothetical protein